MSFDRRVTEVLRVCFDNHSGIRVFQYNKATQRIDGQKAEQRFHYIFIVMGAHLFQHSRQTGMGIPAGAEGPVGNLGIVGACDGYDLPRIGIFWTHPGL